MYICDAHVHTGYSFDADKTEQGKLDAIAASAISRGLSEVCITDHYDINGIIEGIYEPYDSDAARAAILAAKDKYKDKIKITYGIELGQPTQYPDEAREFLRKYDFEFVIGSMHNIAAVPDFYFIDYTLMTQAHVENLWERYLGEVAELASFEGITTLAHLTYPVRYFNKYGRELDVMRWRDSIAGIFDTIIKRGVALEVNTSGLRQGMGKTMPDLDTVKLYYECGGRLVTCGSDAHTAGDVGADIEFIYRELARIGFREIATFSHGKLTTHPINTI